VEGHLTTALWLGERVLLVRSTVFHTLTHKHNAARVPVLQ